MKARGKKINGWIMGIAFGMLSETGAQAVVTLETLDFKVENGSSQLSIQSDQPFEVTSTQNGEDRQIILEIQDAKLGKMATRKLDTSSFNSPVQLVSPYQIIESGGNLVRVVVQLKQMVTPTVASQGNSVQVTFNGESVNNQTAGLDDSPTLPGVNPNLAKAEKSTKSKVFTGKPVTLQVRDADVQDVLRMIGEASGFNIVLGSGVSGKVTLSMIEVPWDQALDVILNTLKLGAERSHNVLRIVTLAELTSEKKAQFDAKMAQQAAAPRVTRLFPISYANPDDLIGLLKDFGKGGPSAIDSQLKVDKRTNSILAQDIAENLDRMAKIIELLDTQTPQILIEGKIVDASESFAKSLGGSLAFGREDTGAGPFYASLNNGDPSTALVSGPSGGGAGSAGFSPFFGFFKSFDRVNALLTIAESESKVKVITSPKTVVLNKEKSNITQSIPVAVPIVTTDATGGNQTTIQFLEAKIDLGVTASVTNDESVLLDLNISRDVPTSVSTGNTNATGVGKRNITTKVIVDNGSTLVIGGIYSSTIDQNSSGVPFLRKLPLIGFLFGQEGENTQRSEIFFFVTPKILNRKAAGFLD